MAAAPTNAGRYSILCPNFSATRSNTFVASATISGPMPSPAKRAILTSIVVIVYFNDIQHFDSRLDGSLRLVGVQPAGLELAAVHLPGDDRLHEGVGAASGRNRNGIVAQHRKLAPELFAVDLPQGAHEGVVLAVARRGPLVRAAVNLDPERRDGVHPLRQREAVIENPDRGVDRVVAQHVGDDIRQVLGRHLLLLVAQLDHPFGHLAHRGLVEVDAQRFEVFQDIGLARGFA